jgi:hypothetical protein
MRRNRTKKERKKVKTEVLDSLLADVCKACEALDLAKDEYSAVLKDVQGRLVEEVGLKVGDVVIVNDWSHNGKKMKIDAFSMRIRRGHRDTPEVSLSARGPVLKMDGEPSKMMGEYHIPLTDKEMDKCLNIKH